MTKETKMEEIYAMKILGKTLLLIVVILLIIAYCMIDINLTWWTIPIAIIFVILGYLKLEFGNSTNSYN